MKIKLQLTRALIKILSVEDFSMKSAKTIKWMKILNVASEDFTLANLLSKYLIITICLVLVLL